MAGKASTARKLRRGSVTKDYVTIGSTVHIVYKRISNGGNAKLTKARRKHPKSKYVILGSEQILGDSTNIPQ